MPYKSVTWKVAVPESLMLHSESGVSHIIVRSIGGKRRARMEISSLHGGAEIFGLDVQDFLEATGKITERNERAAQMREYARVEHDARMRMIASGRLLASGAVGSGSTDDPEVLPALPADASGGPSGASQERSVGSGGLSSAPTAESASQDAPALPSDASETTAGPGAKSDAERAREYPPDKTIKECLSALVIGGNQQIDVPAEFSDTLDFDSETFVCLECLRRNKLIELTEQERGNS